MAAISTRAGVTAVVVALLAVLAILYVLDRIFLPGRRSIVLQLRQAVSGACSPVRAPERVPSSGIFWSKEQYPGQYAESNRCSVEMRALAPGSDPEFPERQRFADVGGMGYSRELVSSFSYSSPTKWQPQVRVEYLKRGETFAGRVSARKLKPNFAYQLKLKGNFADRDAFERIGRLGRWRLPDSGTNCPDDVYAAFPDKNRVESYLFFDFLVTDVNGNADHEFYADSTLHVIFNATWQRTPEADDSRPLAVQLGGSGSEPYANPVPEWTAQEIYAQTERNSPSASARPQICEAFLAPGRYTAELVLTEESFHTFGDGGFWATVMSAPVEFEVVEQARPAPLAWESVEPVLPLSLERASLSDIEKAAFEDGALMGEATTSRAWVTFQEGLDLPAGERYVVAFELLLAGGQRCELCVDGGRGFEQGLHYRAASGHCEGWRRFEVEITDAVAGCKARLRLAPSGKKGPIGLRNVSVCRIVEGLQGGAASER